MQWIVLENKVLFQLEVITLFYFPWEFLGERYGFLATVAAFYFQIKLQEKKPNIFFKSQGFEDEEWKQYKARRASAATAVAISSIQRAERGKLN